MTTLKRSDDLGMAEAFGRDPILEQMVRDAVREHGIRTICETGSWRGYTTRRMAEFVENVITIEYDPMMFAATQEMLRGITNVVQYLGDSSELLPKIISQPVQPVLYYLDAHWHENWPLLDEIEAIAEAKHKCCIVIHDCMVPNTDLGYDTYSGTPLTLNLLRPVLDELPFKWRYYFNGDNAQGHRRGALFVVPCG